MRNREIGLRNGSSGFTLIEAVMAAMVTTILLAGVYGTFRTAQQSVNAAQAASDVNQLGRALLSDITRELSNCYPFADDNETTDQPRPLFRAVDDQDSTTGLEVDSLEFVTASAKDRPDEGPRSDLVKVRYEINRVPKLRSAGLLKFLDYYPGLAAVNGSNPALSEAEPAVTVEEVRSLSFRYWDSESGQWTDQWENQDSLPSAVEVTMGVVTDPAIPLGEEQRKDMVFFTSATDLPMYRSPIEANREQSQETAASGVNETRPDS